MAIFPRSTSAGNALLARADPVTNARSAHRDRADAGHNLALGQVTVAHQPLTSIIGELVGVALEKPGHLRCDSLGQKRAGTAAQHLSQRVGQRTWLGKLENITVGHGVSLLQWRSGGENTPTIRRLTLSCRHQLLRIAPPELRDSIFRIPSVSRIEWQKTVSNVSSGNGNRRPSATVQLRFSRPSKFAWPRAVARQPLSRSTPMIQPVGTACASPSAMVPLPHPQSSTVMLGRRKGSRKSA